MKKTISILLILMMTMMSSVIAYGGGGSGIFLPLPGKQEHMILKHSFDDVLGYQFQCTNVQQSFMIEDTLYVDYVCPKNYPMSRLKTKFVEKKPNSGIEVYLFNSQREILVEGNKVISAFMVKAKPIHYLQKFEMNVNVPTGKKYVAYFGKNLESWKELHNLELVGYNGKEDIYKLNFDMDAKYIMMAEVLK